MPLTSDRNSIPNFATIPIPFAVWGFLGFIARSVVERRIDPWMLVSQILVGAPANSPLWFMSVLMAVTILLFVVLKCCKSWGLLLMGGACIVLQYSGINGMAWRGLPVAAEITMGRIVELMPYAIMGVFLQKKYRSKSLPIFMIGVFVMIIGILLRNLIGDFCFRNYNYGGVVRMMGATGLFMCCTKLDEFVPIRNQAVVSGIVWAASLTAGIYYMHKIVGEVIVRSGFFASGTVWLTIVVFVLCATSVCAIRRVGMGRVVA